MSKPTESKTDQARILEYVEAISASELESFVPQLVAEFAQRLNPYETDSHHP